MFFDPPSQIPDRYLPFYTEMQPKFDIKTIYKKIIIRNEENPFLKILILLIYPFLLLFGGIFMVCVWFLSLFQHKEKIEPRENYFEKWILLAECKNLKIFKKYFAEIRFGPEYFFLKSEPKIPELNDKHFGDWFFRFENQIFLQQWNSTASPNTNLIVINCEDFTFETLKTNLKSVNWKMENNNENFILTTNTGYEIIKYEIKKNGR